MHVNCNECESAEVPSLEWSTQYRSYLKRTRKLELGCREAVTVGKPVFPTIYAHVAVWHPWVNWFSIGYSLGTVYLGRHLDTSNCWRLKGVWGYSRGKVSRFLLSVCPHSWLRVQSSWCRRTTQWGNWKSRPCQQHNRCHSAEWRIKNSRQGGNCAASLSYSILSLRLLLHCSWETSLEDRQTNCYFGNSP